ncbi:esterase-like activity of phytase family protein [Methylomonas rhizoryzae]|uniref:esterase-like activity of phytase family protein n=1 Tax=Methylomonas rhizoryzae TaxID=2608981 RepID=UPI001232604B|nr:esterase-like activity of phytase family protein [Methylomonas rhizoryzae]
MNKILLQGVLLALAGAGAAQAAPMLLAVGSLTGTEDLSGLSGTLENGVDAANVLGGIGSGLAYAGNHTFLALPDRGPNATAWNSAVDDTTSYIARFQTVSMALTPSASGPLPFTLTPTLTDTTLLSSSTPLNYGAVTPSINTASQYYFSGRSDNFAAGLSTNPNNGRLDPEGVRVSNDGTKVYISDEYGPYVYEFDRATGERTKTFTLPDSFAISDLSSMASAEIAGNSIGRVTNKGMEGLAITPDGKTLVGFEQSALLQDGGDGARVNRIVTIDIETGATHEYAYDNYLADKGKGYNSSEILAVNDHEFLVLERDGKGLGDGSNAAVKRLYMVDLDGADDVSSIFGETELLAHAVEKSLFLDIKTALNDAGFSNSQIPSKLEGAAFGEDVVDGNGTLYHTLYIANDNDFLPDYAGQNQFFVFGFTDADLNGSVLELQQIAAVPLPAAGWLFAGGLLGGLRMRRHKR